MFINSKFIIIFSFLTLFITYDIFAIVFERRKTNNQNIFEYYFLVTPI